MKKILHVIAQYPGKTGSGIFLQSLVKEGAKQNYVQGVVYATSNKIEEAKFYDDSIKLYPVEFNTEKMNFNIVGMSDIMPYESTKYSELTKDMFNIWYESFFEAIKKAIEEFKPDIIISQHLYVLTSIINKIREKTKLIVLSQGTELRQLKLVPKYNDLVINGCKDVDIVASLNNYQKEEIVKTYNFKPEKVKVMGVGYNSDVFYYNNEKKSRKVVYAGKISSSKGVKSLINAFKNIKDENIELLIIGSGANEEETIKNLAIGDRRIKFLGALPQEELADILRKSELFILPSFYEGLPLVIMEALACNVKVIVSDIKGIKPWIGEKINSSGAIFYLPLPRLIDVDIPHEDDVLDFEEGIKKCIISEIDKVVDFNNIKDEIKGRSWKGYFDRLSKYFI